MTPEPKPLIEPLQLNSHMALTPFKVEFFGYSLYALFDPEQWAYFIEADSVADLFCLNEYEMDDLVAYITQGSGLSTLDDDYEGSVKVLSLDQFIAAIRWMDDRADKIANKIIYKSLRECILKQITDTPRRYKE